jgi:hypothetical protein
MRDKCETQASLSGSRGSALAARQAWRSGEFSSRKTHDFLAAGTAKVLDATALWDDDFGWVSVTHWCSR